MKIRIIEFEGSEQEYQAVAHLLGAAATATDAVARPAPLDPVAQAVRALSRIPLPNPARDLLEAVVAAGPKGIPVGALAARLGVASERPSMGTSARSEGGSTAHRARMEPAFGCCW